MRLIRLSLGAYLFAVGMTNGEYGFGFLGLFFALQAVFNVGCCGISACSTNSTTPATTKENSIIDYEEVKKP